MKLVADSRLPKNFPDFFIVGQPKCGTTALYEMLKQHPQIYMPDFKELWFFASELRYRALPSPFGKLPETLDDYLSFFDAANPEQRVGEASPLYLWSQTAAGSIAAVQPAADIIAILREPASFLRSLHLQFVQAHIETENDLRKAIAFEGARREGRNISRSSYWPQVLLYSDHVRYVDQLRRYHELFTPEHMLVLIYDDFLHDNEATVRTVLRFLDVDDKHQIDRMEVNPTVFTRSQTLDTLVGALAVGQGPISRAAKAGVKALTPQQLRRKVLQATYRRIVFGTPQPSDENLMMEIRRRFKPEVVALSEYLNRDLVTLWGYDNID